MSMIRKTITISSPMEDWIKSRIASGDYANDSEYVRDLIRHDRQRSAVSGEIRAMMERAEASGVSDKTLTEIWFEAEGRASKSG